MHYQLTSGGAGDWDQPCEQWIMFKGLSPNKNSVHWGLNEFPGWQYFVCIVTHRCQERNAILTPQGDNWKLQFGTALANVSFPLVNFNLYSFPEINCIHKCGSFKRALWVFLVNYQNWGWFGETPNLYTVWEVKSDLAGTLPSNFVLIL